MNQPIDVPQMIRDLMALDASKLKLARELGVSSSWIATVLDGTAKLIPMAALPKLQLLHAKHFTAPAVEAPEDRVTPAMAVDLHEPPQGDLPSNVFKEPKGTVTFEMIETRPPLRERVRRFFRARWLPGRD